MDLDSGDGNGGLDDLVDHLGSATGGAVVIDRGNHIQARGHLTEQGVGGGQLGAAGADHDEELAAVGVGTTVGHGQAAGHVLAGGGGEFVLELVARAPAAGPGGDAALVDEARDHPVEGGAVVVVVPDQEHEVVDRHRRL